MRAGLLGMLTGALLAAAAWAEPADIEATIDRQLMAFQEDDFETAFTFASPTLQRMFGTPRNFQRMVTEGYPMVWRFSDVQFLGLREEAGALWQRVRITDARGVVHLLDYRMLQTPDGWRISGVKILDAADFAA